MTQAQHTPGPWEIHIGVIADQPHAIDVTAKTNGWTPGDDLTPAGWFIATVHNLDGEANANARLIAAAPELLAVVRSSIEILEVAIESREELIGEPDEVLRDLMIQSRAALAKAAGDA